MVSDRDLLAQNPLFGEYGRLEGFEGVSESELPSLQGLVLDVAEIVGPHLDRIRETFTQYTEHDLRHLLNVADGVFRFLPRRVTDDGQETIALNALELTYLWLAVLLHDVGMFVSSANEKQELLDSAEYKTYERHTLDRREVARKADEAGLTVRAQSIRDTMFAEFIRRRHAERVHKSNDPHAPERCEKNLEMRNFVGQTCSEKLTVFVQERGDMPCPKTSPSTNLKACLGMTRTCSRRSTSRTTTC